jgi:uncharacterized protein
MSTRRALSTVGLGGTAALLAVAGGASWYYAGRITEPPGLRTLVPAALDRVEIVASEGATLTLRGPDAARQGWWGVATRDAYARVGPPLRVDEQDRTAERGVELRAGRLPVGATALLDAYAAPSDPRLLPEVGTAVREVEIDGPVGALPTWWFPAPGPTWAVVVHGRSGVRQEAFRLVPLLTRLGLPTLAISYRNDPEGPPSPDGRSHLGATEWQDVEAAVAWARSQGARDVVLVGMSMGGACSAELVRRSPLAGHVRALVLDAPVLDWGPVIRRAAVARGLPNAVLPLLLPPTMALAERRTQIDWRGLRHLHDPEGYDRPTLLIHGDADATVPVELADAFADTRPDVVTYLRVPGAGHVRAWNHDRDRYEAAVTDFLERVGATGRG